MPVNCSWASRQFPPTGNGTRRSPSGSGRFKSNFLGSAAGGFLLFLFFGGGWGGEKNPIPACFLVQKNLSGMPGHKTTMEKKFKKSAFAFWPAHVDAAFFLLLCLDFCSFCQDIHPTAKDQETRCWVRMLFSHLCSAFPLARLKSLKSSAKQKKPELAVGPSHLFQPVVKELSGRVEVEMLLHSSGEGSGSSNQLSSLPAAGTGSARAVGAVPILHPAAQGQTVSPGKQEPQAGARNLAISKFTPPSSLSC